MPYINCKEIAEKIEQETKGLLQSAPVLKVFFPRDDEPAEQYFKSLSRCGKRVGIEVVSRNFYPTISLAAFAGSVEIEEADGIMVLSEPPHLHGIRDCIGDLNVEGDDHNDDVENLFCTARACYEVIESLYKNLEGMNATVVGYGKRVGKPLTYLLMRKHVGTVTTTHKYTKSLLEHTTKADILISAVGKGGFITPDLVKPGSLVIDVGCDSHGRGDVDPSVQEIANVTPVPGGVGPITTALIMKNVALKSRKEQTV